MVDSRVGYSHLISSKLELDNCFNKNAPGYRKPYCDEIKVIPKITRALTLVELALYTGS